MSDVIVSTTESTTNVTTVNDVTTIAITNNVVEVSQATAGLQGPPGANSDPTYVFVTNKTGSTLAKGSIVYVSGANGVHTQVSLALAVGDITSARTLGWLSENIANNATGLCCVEGYLDGINTQGVTEGAQLYLSPTIPGAFTETKPVASDHLVYVGVCAKASAGNGRVFVKVQNGYELNELHDVKTVNLANNDLLRYSASTALWENVAATAITVGSAITSGTSVYATNAGTSVYASTSGTSVYATNAGTAVDLSGSITKSQVSDFTSGTVASASTAQQAGTAVYATTSGSASVSGSAVAYTGSITISQITDLANATVTSASTAQQAGTSVYASTAGTSVYATNAGTSVYAETSGTATYATTSGTAVSISGTITRSQVSDYASGTVANISGTVSQSQVSNLVTDLAGKAGLADNNTFTGTNTFSNFTTFQAAADAIPIRVFGANGQSADLFSVNDYLTNTQFEILSDGRAQSLKGIIATVSSTASVPLVVRGTAGQSANLLEIQNSGSTVLSAITSTGIFSGTATNASTAVALSGTVTQSQVQNLTTDLAGKANLAGGNSFTGAQVLTASTATDKPLTLVAAAGQTADLLSVAGGARIPAAGNYFIAPGIQATYVASFTAGATSVVPVTISGVASQSANLTEWKNSSGATAISVTSAGNLNVVGQARVGTTSGLGQLAVVSTGTATIAAVIRGAASQSANLQEWQSSGGGTISSVDAFGNAGFGGTAASSSFGLRVATNANPAVIGIAVVGAASQSADLQQWRNSSGGTVASVASNGVIKGAEVRTNNTQAVLREVAGGGNIYVAKSTATPAAPGSNVGTLYFRDGTNAGTLKLVVRAGTAGAETTILDNIPQS